MNEKKEREEEDENTEGKEKRRKSGLIQKNTLFWNGFWRQWPSSKDMATVHEDRERASTRKHLMFSLCKWL